MKGIFKLALAGLAFAQKSLEECAIQSVELGQQNGWWVTDLDELGALSPKHQRTSVLTCVGPQRQLQGLQSILGVVSTNNTVSDTI